MSRCVVAASVVATIAFYAYTRTLLPGVDLGDTGGFQAAVLWPETSARQGYPLYYTLARPFVLATSASNPARGLNLFSAVLGAAAVGVLVLLAGVLTRSAVSAAVSGLLLAFSYTFWTQAVIAEVYTLHLALIGACLIALEAYRRQPGVGRLAVFFAIYAGAFGNHLSMILLLVPFAAFLIAAHPRPRELFDRRTIGLALAIAGAGALQYAPNFISAWTSVDAPSALPDRVAAFWFDATKTDWRETSVLGIRADQASDRLAMWVWDARQQFGVAGLALAVVGAIRLWTISRAWGVCVWLAYAICTGFALTYNVGDTHVFFLPSHYLTALAAGVAVAPFPSRWRTQPARTRAMALVAVTALGYATWRGWDTWPAADRHDDRRGEELVGRLTYDLDEHRALLLSKMDWQAENALLYSSRYHRRDIAWRRLADVLSHFPFFVRDNLAIGRDIVLTADAAAAVVAAYGPVFPVIREDLPPLPLVETANRIPPGASYVLGILRPLSDEPFDQAEIDAAFQVLSGGRLPRRSRGAFEVIAGIQGQSPQFYRAADRPFRQRISVQGESLTVRMDSWLPTDTFRRGGFGHVLRGREHVLALERGVNLVWFGRDGSPVRAYASNVYGHRPRFRIAAEVARLAEGRGGAR